MTATCEEILRAVQSSFGSAFADVFGVKFVRCDEVLELYAGEMSRVAPMYLPVWGDGNGDFFAMHLDPRKNWMDQAWVLVRHDRPFPELIASSIKALPCVLPLTPLAYPAMTPERWKELEASARSIPGACPLDQGVLASVSDLAWGDARGQLDPGNTLEVLISSLEACPEVRAIADVLRRWRPHQGHDSFAHALLAIAEKEVEEGEAVATARDALRGGFLWCSERRVHEFNLQMQLDTVLDRLRQVAFESQAAAGPLEPLRDVDLLTTSAGVPAHMEAAKCLLREGETDAAFNVACNGLSLAASWEMVTGEWLELLRAAMLHMSADSAAHDLLTLYEKCLAMGD